MRSSNAVMLVQSPDLLSKDSMIRALPKRCKTLIHDTAVTEINRLITTDPELQEQYRDNLLGYVEVLRQGKYKINSYIDAVRYVSYKLMGNNNTVAYSKTFPDRYDRLLAGGAEPKDISAYACSYNKNKLVNLIFAQTLIPTHIMNADLHQEAINRQASLMRDAKSEKVRCEAADSLLKHLKPPEGAVIELNVKASEDDSLTELKEITRTLAMTQKRMLESGTLNAQEVAESRIVKEVNPMG